MNEIDIYSRFDDDSADNNTEKVKLFNKGNHIQQLSLQSFSSQEKIDHKQNLPGQVLVEEEVLSSSSSSEFDVETFRNANANVIQQNKSGLQQDDQICGENQLLKFLGINFQIAYLKERNRDPVLFLKCLFTTFFTQNILNIIIFAVGLQFKILPTIVSIILNIGIGIVMVYICKNSVKNGIKFQPIFLFSTLVVVSSFLVLFLYSLLVQTPFNSEPVFLLLNFLNALLGSFIFSLSYVPNFTPKDDLNYQQNFFAPRIMSAFFNAVGVIDASSDIVLGINLIQGSSKKLLVLGIFLVVLSNIDYLYAAGKIFTPSKIALNFQIVTLAVEVIVMALTVVVLVDVSKTSEDDTLFVTLISLTTTIINFLHNLLLVQYQFAKSNLNVAEKIVTFVG